MTGGAEGGCAQRPAHTEVAAMLNDGAAVACEAWAESAAQEKLEAKNVEATMNQIPTRANIAPKNRTNLGVAKIDFE